MRNVNTNRKRNLVLFECIVLTVITLAVSIFPMNTIEVHAEEGVLSDGNISTAVEEAAVEEVTVEETVADESSAENTIVETIEAEEIIAEDTEIEDAEAEEIYADDGYIYTEDEDICELDTALAGCVQIQYGVKYCQTEARKLAGLVNDFRTGDKAYYWYNDNETKIDETGSLSAYTYDYTLEEIAMTRVAEYAIHYDYSKRPSGRASSTIYEEFNYHITTYGNFIFGMTKNCSAEELFSEWEGAEEDFEGQVHRRKMLTRAGKYIAGGCVYYNGYYYWIIEVASALRKTANETVANDSEVVFTTDLSSDLIREIYFYANTDSIYVLKEKGENLPTATCNVILTNYARIDLVPDCTYKIANEAIAEIRDNKIYGLQDGTTYLYVSMLGKTVTVPVTVGNGGVTCSEVSGYSMSIIDGGKSDLIIYFNIMVEDLGDFYAQIEIRDSTGKAVRNQRYDTSLNGGEIKFVYSYDDWNYLSYKLECPLSITEISHKIVIKMYADNKLIGEYQISVEDYLYKLYEGDAGKTKEIAKDLLNYGTAVQNYFNINKSSPVNQKMAEKDKVVETVTDLEYLSGDITEYKTDGGIPGLDYVGASLVLQGIEGIYLRLYFYAKDVNVDELEINGYYTSTLRKDDFLCVDVKINIGRIRKNMEGSGGIWIGSKNWPQETDVNVELGGYFYPAIQNAENNKELADLISALCKLDYTIGMY